MSKPPVRVVAQPPPPHPQALSQQYHQQNPMMMYSAPNTRPHVIPTMQVQPTMAAQIKRNNPVNAQFQNPSEMIADYGVKPQSVEMVQRVRAVRRQVADEETELRRLRELEHETAQLQNKNYGRERELNVQGSMLKEAQLELRNASMRAQSLNKHLEEMYRRRQTAAAAALVEQRKMQQHQILLARAANQVSTQEVIRPRASVEPFQVNNTQQQQPSPQMMKSEEFSEKRDLNGQTGSYDAIDGSGDHQKIPTEPSYLAPCKENQQKYSELSKMASTDPHSNHSSPSTSSQKAPTLITFSPPSFEQKINSSTMTRDSPFVERPTSFGDSLDESRLRSGKTDLVSLRSDSLKATKRRSWAASEGTSMSEAEMIHRLLDEQRRGRSHFIPQLPTSQEEPSAITSETYAEEVVNSESKQVATSSDSTNNLELPTEQMVLGSDTTTEEDASSCSTRSDDGQNLEMEVAIERRTVKGILRRPNEKMNKGRIEFDPLALLLDAALEGELDLVRSSASKLTDVSQANDEGITALHNAICAGHYEIVRFLIENDADVNAQDSDGWTPLHCAASCNNLPMVRQLVEGGGCVLASTLSDMETPVEKCEEDEDGYDGCLKYLSAAHNSTGSINTGKVYAAYGYEAAFEDELSFDAGDELTVIEKDKVDKNWWTCEKNNGEKGQVPRTYLALYPSLKYRKKLNFVMFDLPLESNNNVE
ncbi:Apoptotic enhancer 1 protein [Caenorhabditis elegans]|nr:Apoptotic enhancer 1 protein [Caenorhabditis elegans]CBW44381.1 Apoptotic enhancer 1 protein [Caenorhabditis elegans]|eukprot:NP_001256354.1 Apoptotic enhancer 1 protein [Caenorhabditis elegans]